jgi:hypothetical protein
MTLQHRHHQQQRLLVHASPFPLSALMGTAADSQAAPTAPQTVTKHVDALLQTTAS